MKNIFLSILPIIIGIFGTLLGIIITGFINVYISNTKRKNELRLAALDKRLDAHQKAYSISNMFRNNINVEDSRGKMINQFDEFWNNYCLYLAPNSRKAIMELYKKYMEFPDIPRNEKPGKLFIDLLKKTKYTLEKDVELPPLGNQEFIDRKIVSEN